MGENELDETRLAEVCPKAAELSQVYHDGDPRWRFDLLDAVCDRLVELADYDVGNGTCPFCGGGDEGGHTEKCWVGVLERERDVLKTEVEQLRLQVIVQICGHPAACLKMRGDGQKYCSVCAKEEFLNEHIVQVKGFVEEWIQIATKLKNKIDKVKAEVVQLKKIVKEFEENEGNASAGDLWPE